MITRWDPFADISRLQDEVFGIRRANRPETFAPLVDIFEEKDAIYVKAELPGVKLEDIHVNLDEHVLTLTGERKFEKDYTKDNVHRVERSYGSFKRAFTLPDVVQKSEIHASLEHGVLTVKLPKRADTTPRKIPVSSGTASADIPVEKN